MRSFSIGESQKSEKKFEFLFRGGKRIFENASPVLSFNYAAVFLKAKSPLASFFENNHQL